MLQFDVVGSLIRTILTGSLYTLIAIGITQCVAVAKTPNFAQGELVTIGAYASALISLIFGFPISFIVGIAIASALGAGAGLLSDEAVYKPLQQRGTSSIGILAASISLSMIYKYSIYVIARAKGFLLILNNLNMAGQVAFLKTPFITVNNLFAWLVPSTICLALALQYMFTHTKTGKAMRAVAANAELAQSSGVSIKKIRRLTWIISGGLTGLSGFFWSIYIVTTPELGWLIMLRGFSAAVIGGLSSFSGALVGGYIVGAGENIIMDILSMLFSLPVALKPIVTISITIIFLIFKPEGLTTLGFPQLKGVLERVQAKLPSIGRRAREL